MLLQNVIKSFHATGEKTDQKTDHWSENLWFFSFYQGVSKETSGMNWVNGYMIDSSAEYTLATKRFFKLTHSQPMFQFYTPKNTS